eukprot:CAMPEP_0113910856 /NCGR_PEP_ID=MMETSP0780_2-20120614/27800_1 /TAXON_ID=652834 /ORGANISM="Palpitomonas bilix" /LENGTH=213 /DNA_ID=CAMNT_0000907143 /DNA_START=35 /DNA_END=673 /DNA_ORIENTATION=+ /assembly_acc=CAM_ASM_000599
MALDEDMALSYSLSVSFESEEEDYRAYKDFRGRSTYFQKYEKVHVIGIDRRVILRVDVERKEGSALDIPEDEVSVLSQLTIRDHTGFLYPITNGSLKVDGNPGVRFLPSDRSNFAYLFLNESRKKFEFSFTVAAGDGTENLSSKSKAVQKNLKLRVETFFFTNDGQPLNLFPKVYSRTHSLMPEVGSESLYAPDAITEGTNLLSQWLSYGNSF